MSIDHTWPTPRAVLTATLASVITAGLLLVAVPAVSVDAASPKACYVRNVSQAEGYRSLALAVRQARDGDKLTVRGICKGRIIIWDKRLRIIGVRTTLSGPPTLLSDGRARVLTIRGWDADVALRNILIRGNPRRLLGFEGGGIRVVKGKITLRDCTVRSFSVSRRGGAISLFRGSVTLQGSSSIKGNSAFGDGGGIHSEGAGSIRLEDTSRIRLNVTGTDGGGIATEGAGIVLLDSSSITGNLTTRDGDGGGIWSEARPVTMLDSSTIAGNEARHGGGIRTQGRLEMSATASITGNVAREDRGGIDAGLGYTPVGVVCAPAAGPNVFGNSPDDCGP